MDRGPGLICWTATGRDGWSLVSYLSKQEADSPGHVIGGNFIGVQLQQYDGMRGAVRTENEAVGFEVKIADEHGVGVMHGIKSGFGGVIAHEGVVMAIDDSDGVRGKDGFHRSCLDGADADGDEAEPVFA